MSRGSRRGLRVSIALAAIGGCFAAAAYATTRGGAEQGSAERRGSAPAAPSGRGDRANPPPKPRISAHPAAQTTSKRAKFAFSDRQSGVRFRCRLDRERWQACRPPVSLDGLTPGRHSFSVRALNRRGTPSRPARFRWTRLEEKDFSIVPDLAGLKALYPGAPPLALPLTVSNPNDTPILVTSLRVSVAADPSECSGAENLALVQSSASISTPLRVPGGGSARVPTARVAAPTIQLRDLPVNQDACQGARFQLEFTGSAHG